jgi:hypothetical protein
LVLLLNNIWVVRLLVALSLVKLLDWNIIKFVHEFLSFQFLVSSLVTTTKEVCLAQPSQNHSLLLLRSIYILLLVHIRISLGFGMLLYHNCWLLLINWLLILQLLLLWSNLEQILVFFVDVAYLPIVPDHHLRMIVALNTAVLKTTIHKHGGRIKVLVGCAQRIISVINT